MFADVRAAARFAVGLGPFLTTQLSKSQAAAALAETRRLRERNFLGLLEAAVFAHARNPSGALLRWAGISLEAATSMVRQLGIEQALARMHDAGVYVTIDEFKGNAPIIRPGLRLDVKSRDYANPLAAGHVHGTSGGSRSAGTALSVNLDSLAQEAAYVPFVREAHGIEDASLILWRPGPPGMAGLNICLFSMKVGVEIRRWFSQTPVRWDAANRKYALLLSTAIGVSRVAGRSLPAPEHVPLTEAVTVARAVSAARQRGRNVVVDAPASSAVRVCRAAVEQGVNIAGAVFRTGGEPLTQAKGAAIQAAGCTAYCNYFMAEFGTLGLACGDRAALDDVHIAHDRIALVQRQRDLDGTTVGALYATPLHPLARRVVINAETGDFAQISQRDCNCVFGRLGYGTHLTHIRSYEKLTSEGMTFLGSTLADIVERDLPARFGGGPGDYQFVEAEVDGLPRVTIVVSPRVGDADPGVISAAVLDALGGASAPRRMMATFLRDGDAIRVQRREPFATRSAKVHALHILKPEGH